MNRDKIRIRRRVCECHGVASWVVTDPVTGFKAEFATHGLAYYAAEARGVELERGAIAVTSFLMFTTRRRARLLAAERDRHALITEQLIAAEVDRAVDHFENAGSEPPC
ncbi:hypothetical protein [Brevibacterium gallinarum]|uniref:Uncharacterized protein n=1 Tax=Brevibacterium gallinarum TaxID=2762220 RepID=A0ABR8WR10_9MICO|nr:hypothetical protein [Brevibacterium gallinarum]MBD8019357.1 hypothetical protein [Brevibacterium gallinarum]